MSVVGQVVYCARCGKRKAPRGRSVPPEIWSGFCHADDCPGWDLPPRVGDLWPGETAEEFGYPCEGPEV